VTTPFEIQPAQLRNTAPHRHKLTECSSDAGRTARQCYNRTASLSYTGDFRMQVGGEDPLKITKLVEAPGQLQRFHSLYRNDILKPLEKFGLLLEANDKHLTWDPFDPSARKFLWEQLPRKKVQDGKEADKIAKPTKVLWVP
jgi:hypothetical protein